jgi:hypothetical protein
VLDVFRYNDPPPHDAWVDALLDAFATHPFHLRQARIDGLLHALHSYVTYVPERVIRLANTVVDALCQSLGDIQGHAGTYAPLLVDLALTLQDIPGQLAAGLDLFERLQDLDLSEIEEVLNERETQPGTQPAPRRRPRPTRRRSAR